MPTVSQAKTAKVSPLGRRGKPNASGFLGVYKHPTCNRWVAQIKRAGRATYVGLYETAQEAADARTAFIRKLDAEAKAAQIAAAEVAL